MTRGLIRGVFTHRPAVVGIPRRPRLDRRSSVCRRPTPRRDDTGTRPGGADESEVSAGRPWSGPAYPAGPRRWLGWGAVGGGVVLALLVCVLICLSVVRDAARREPGHGDHDHPPGPHGGAVVAVGRENRHHIEAVFERTGQVRVYTYGEDESRVHPVESRPVPARVRRAAGPTEFDVLLSPEPRPATRRERRHGSSAGCRGIWPAGRSSW